ncbi:MAG: PAS domain-containing protein [Deltaproteobacteria bacterium]|nr:PAS domain-containing protein [Deltaproteobacteria bacterium]
MLGGLLAVIAPRARPLLAAAVGMTLGLTIGTAWATKRDRRAARRIEGSARSSAASLGLLLAHCEDALAVTDASLRLVYVNEAFAALCGRPIDPASGTTLVDALAHRFADDAEFAHTIAELAEDPERESAGELTRLSTPARSFEWRSVPLRDAGGIVTGRGFLFHDGSQARELAGLKGDFLSTVTHELRTPLTSVKGSLQLVLGKSAGLSPIDSELLHISLKNADRLIRLINDLLDISRLELGKIELTFAKVGMPSLIDEAVAGLRAYAAAREITIASSIASDVPALAGDRDRLIQVLTNLISNAVKFSPAGGHVDVSVDACSDEVHIAVRDRGVGIPTADQSRLFQRFQRLHPGHSGEPGSGLGLAISKAIVERHGGTILLDSREHEGSTFTVVLPAIRERARAADATARPLSDEEPPTVLLVDDDVELGLTLEKAWGQHYQLTRVERGAEAIDVARRIRPDVVLLDVVLPDLSGYDVLRILRTTGATATIPVIMLTVQPERALSANLGVVDVVPKPLDVAQLTRAVDRALADRRTVESPRLAVGG